MPLDVKPLGSGRPLEPFVPHDRFSLFVDDGPLGGFPRGAAGAGGAAAGARELSARLTAALAKLTLPRLNAMRCEMACAATHMSWGAPALASCAGPPAHVAGVVPTLYSRCCSTGACRPRGSSALGAARATHRRTRGTTSLTRAADGRGRRVGVFLYKMQYPAVNIYYR